LEIYSKVMDESYDQHDLEDRKSEVWKQWLTEEQNYSF
jgi:hypothetical protein